MSIGYYDSSQGKIVKTASGISESDKANLDECVSALPLIMGLPDYANATNPLAKTTSGNLTYTATDNGILYFQWVQVSGDTTINIISVNGKYIYRFRGNPTSSTNAQYTFPVPLAKGDVVTTSTLSSTTWVQSNSIFVPCKK